MKLIQVFLQVIRGHKRLYKYGTCGLHYFDDRTVIEKLFDYIDKYIDNLKKQFKRQSSRQIWHTFFDVSSGTWITSMSDIRKIERKTGWVYMDKTDIHKEAIRNQKYNQEKQYRTIHKDMTSAIKKISQGYSYVRQAREKITHGDYEIGQRQTGN